MDTGYRFQKVATPQDDTAACAYLRFSKVVAAPEMLEQAEDHLPAERQRRIGAPLLVPLADQADKQRVENGLERLDKPPERLQDLRVVRLFRGLAPPEDEEPLPVRAGPSEG